MQLNVRVLLKQNQQKQNNKWCNVIFTYDTGDGLYK